MKRARKDGSLPEADAIRLAMIGSAAVPPTLEPSGDWQEWVKKNHGRVCSRPFAQRHERVYQWAWDLELGRKPDDALVEIWPRGGGKSTTVEVAVDMIRARGNRRYVLFISETQAQADHHVQSIAALMEARGVQRELGQYGSSRGWRRSELRTKDGLCVSAFGLEGGARGVKLDDRRPDLMIFNDIDGLNDSLDRTAKKEAIITQTLMPAGSSDCGYMFVQNLVTESGVIARLYHRRADWLTSRRTMMYPAVVGLETEMILRGADEVPIYKIVGGKATWEGQDLQTCQAQINDWGLRAFLREAQHECERTDGAYYPTDYLLAYRTALTDFRADPANDCPYDIIRDDRERDIRGVMEIYEPPQKRHTYVVSCDEAEGINRDGAHDFTVVHVLNLTTGKQALSWHVQQPALYCAEVIAWISAEYHGAVVIAEMVGMGTALIERLKDTGCPLYKGKRGKSAFQTEDKIGFVVTAQSKADRDEALRSDLQLQADAWRKTGLPLEAPELTGTVAIRSLRTLDELLRYTMLKGGKRGGLGANDDENTALTQAVWYRRTQYLKGNEPVQVEQYDGTMMWSDEEPDVSSGNSYGGRRRVSVH